MTSESRKAYLRDWMRKYRAGPGREAVRRSERKRHAKSRAARNGACRTYSLSHPKRRTFTERARAGWTRDRFDQYLHAQDGCCAICGVPFDNTIRGPQADHDHENATPRGLLCARCNVGLGMFRDDPECLRLAIDYLASWRRPSQPS